jgi:hypothetical protein
MRYINEKSTSPLLGSATLVKNFNVYEQKLNESITYSATTKPLSSIQQHSLHTPLELSLQTTGEHNCSNITTISLTTM